MKAALITAVISLAAGCDPLECGEGTAERGGTCVPADSVSPDDPRCGDGTVFDPVAMACVPELPPTECGPNTEPVEREDGVIECVGTGTRCADALPCPAPSADAVSICGRLIDTETSAPVTAGDGTDTAPCDPDAPADSGPCSLQLVLVDAAELATNPGGAAPLTAGEISIDRCGRFRALDISPPSSGLLGVAIDDSDAGSVDAHVTTGVGFPAPAGARLDGVTLAATRRSTDQAWTASAGDPFAGQTFSEVGAILITYVHAGLPVSGVEITSGGAPVDDADDFYFAGADPTRRASIDPAATATGVNGGALAVGTPLGEHSGQGSEPDGCTWSSAPGASVEGVIFVTRREAVCP